MGGLDLIIQEFAEQDPNFSSTDPEKKRRPNTKGFCDDGSEPELRRRQLRQPAQSTRDDDRVQMAPEPEFRGGAVRDERRRADNLCTRRGRSPSQRHGHEEDGVPRREHGDRLREAGGHADLFRREGEETERSCPGDGNGRESRLRILASKWRVSLREGTAVRTTS